VRSIFAAWERGDYSAHEWAHPEIEYVFADGPAPGKWTGLAGMARAMRDFLGAWSGCSQQLDACRELDHDRVLVLHEWVGRGKGSGVDLGQIRSQAAAVFHVCDGRVKRLVVYLHRDRAVAELGLAPEGDAR
jgi:ketosteroid isomerase-like protein